MKQIEEAKMVGYKLSKNNWVTPSFVIFRSVREKLLVTVFFDHPVALITHFVKSNSNSGIRVVFRKINGIKWEFFPY